MSAIYLSGMFACYMSKNGATTPTKWTFQELVHEDKQKGYKSFRNRSSLLTGRVGSLGFGDTSDFLHSTLHFLEHLSSLLGLLGSEFISEEHALGVALLSGVNIIVDAGESGGSTTTELGVESEDGDSFWLNLEHSFKLGLNGNLGDGSLIWMDKLNNELLSLEEWVVDHLSSVEDELFLLVGHL
jgi:hypothetical protein